jgi:hypothetical protein
MSVIYCHNCDRHIDTDFDTTHEEDCNFEDALEDAYDAGKAAFAAGKGRAPALDPAFIKRACDDPEDTALLLGEYLRGWDCANLATFL